MIFNTVLYDGVTILNLVTALAAFIIGLFVAKGLSTYLRRILKEKIGKAHLEIIIKIVHYTVIITAILFILPTLGVKLSGLLVAGGIFGLAVGFASQSVIGNLISGIFLILERPIKIGNAVNIEGVTGVVEDIRIMSTTLRTYDGLFVRIPNQKIFTSNITNYVANIARRFEYVVGIRYSDDAEKAIQIIKGLIKEHPFTLKLPESQVFVDNLGDNAVNIFVRIWSPVSEWYDVKMEMLWRIKQALETQGIEIAFPQRVVWFAQEQDRREAPEPETAPAG
jgi:small-conductance mechanosensitive channel